MTKPGPTENRVTLSRRGFLKTSAGSVIVTISGVPALSQSDDVSTSILSKPGVATQRIEGRIKVTGGKIFARDFNARDMDGWPDTQWHAMYLRALNTTQPFVGVDVTSLPADAQPTRVILGSDLTQAQISPVQVPSRDLVMDEKVVQAQADQKGDFDRPDGLLFDLIVRPGNCADFLGQAVALLLFDSREAWAKARRLMQFNDAAYQSYGSEVGPNPAVVFQPETTYVKFAGFSYATANPDTYDTQAVEYAARIEDYMATDPDLIVQDFNVDMQAMDPMFMEPEAGIAWHDPVGDALNLVLGTQSPDGDIRDISSMYDEPGSPYGLKAINLTSCYPGGGFGGRDSSPFSFMIALASAFADNNPVRLEYDRFEQFRVGLKRHAASVKGQLAVAPDKTIKVVRTQMEFDGGGRKNLSPYVASLAALCVGGAYKVPMADIFANAVHSENISGGSQRGFGGPQAYFAIETAMDDVAISQDWDPLEFRRHNLLEAKDTTVTGGPVDQVLQLDEMLDVTARHPLWADRASLKEKYAERGLSYGTGLAMSLQAYGTSGDGVVAAVKMDAEGRLSVQSDAVDMGNGSATTLGVVIGPILGANAETVDMGGYTLFGQTGLLITDDLPFGGKPVWENPYWTAKNVSSSSACLTGLHQVHVVEQTAKAFFEGSLLPAARLIWDLPALRAEQTKWISGALAMRDGSKAEIPRNVLAAKIYKAGLPRGALGHAYFQFRWVSAAYQLQDGGPKRRLELDGLSFYYDDADNPKQLIRSDTDAPAAATKRFARYVWAPCVNVVGLVVDRRSGAVQMENILSVLNAGKIHVDQLVSGQSQGGVAMALGYTLLEDMPPGMDGPADGQWNLNRYHLPRYGDVPLATEYKPDGRAQQLITMPLAEGEKAVGRGIAEAVMCSVAPAISNGLRDAVDVRYTSLPITPEKILGGLR